jgi:hypoxanthine phosphoribosyltransferase
LGYGATVGRKARKETCVIRHGLFLRLFVVFGVLADTPAQIAKGIYQDCLCADVLITTYRGGGMGAAFLTRGFLMLATVLILYLLKVR